MFRNRSTVEIMVLVFTFMVTFAILATGATIAIVEVLDPDTDTASITDTLATLVGTIIGALMGLLAGKSETLSGSGLDKRPSDKDET